jgi:hypothetical protein
MTLDRMHSGSTFLVGGVCAAGLVSLLFAAGATKGIATFAIVGILLALAWAMSPREVIVDGEELRVVRRAWWPLRVSLSAIAAASQLDSLGARPVRVFGVGGFFGSYGLFSTRLLGRFHLYSTRRGQAVLVRRNDDRLPIVVTPDDVAGTIAAIDRRPLLSK